MPGSRSLCPPRAVHLCRRLPCMGILFCAPVLLSPACAPVLPPVLLTRRLPCTGISLSARTEAGLPARICPAPRWPRTCFAGAARFAAHGAPCGEGLFFVILNTLHARGTKRAAERARPCPERARRAAARKGGDAMKALWPDLKGYRAQLVLGPLFKLAEAILELLVPLLMADIIDVGVKTGDVRYIVTHGLAMLGLGAVGLGCALTCQYFAAVCAQGFGRSLRRRLFSRVMALSRSQYGAVGTDSLITRLTSDANQVQTGVNMFIRLAVRAVSGHWLHRHGLHHQRADRPCVPFVSTPLIVLVLYAVMRKTVPMYGGIQAGQDGIARLAGEHLEGVRVIRAFGRQKAEVQAFDKAGASLAAATVRAGVISAALNPHHLCHCKPCHCGHCVDGRGPCEHRRAGAGADYCAGELYDAERCWR